MYSTLSRQSKCHRTGFTILELLVSISIISVLMGILLPAVGSAREAARRLQCTNHLKQIGIALHNYHDVHRGFPAGWQWGSDRESARGWAVGLLPFLEQQAALPSTTSIGFSATTSTTSSNQLATLPIFLCPSDITEPSFMQYPEINEVLMTNMPISKVPTGSYIGMFGTFEPDDEENFPRGDGAFVDSRSLRIAEFTGGLSNTLFVGERTMAQLPSTWLGVDAHCAETFCRMVGFADQSPNCHDCEECEFFSRHSGGTNFLWGDGHVKLVSENTDSNVYKSMARRDGS